MANFIKDVQISWSAVTGAVAYVVEQQTAQPGSSDFTTIATVDSPSLSYTYAGRQQDELSLFRVTAVSNKTTLTVCPASNAVQMVGFPQYSGAYVGEGDTPDGQPFVHPVDVPYVTKEEFILHPSAAALGLTASSTEYTNGTLDMLILSASASVNRYCKRYFQRQTIDEKYPNITISVTNPRLCVIPLKNGPVHRVNSVSIQVLKWFIPFSLEYLQTFYDQAYYKIVPMLTANGTGTPIPSVLLEQSQLGIVWTNYTCGYDVIPSDIKFATCLIAAKMYGQSKFNPLGLTSMSTQTFSQSFGAQTSDSDLDPMAMNMLKKYKRVNFAIS